MLLQFLINVFSSNFDEFISVMARNESTGKGGTFHRVFNNQRNSNGN